MAQTMKISAMKDLVVDDGVAPCPSHGSIVNRARKEVTRILYLTPLFLSRNVNPASGLPHQPDLVLYLVLEHFFRDHENHCPDWLRRGYLVLYLTGPFSPETLIIGVALPPLLDLLVPTLEIAGIRLRPFSLALPFPLRPARRLRATLLGLPCSSIRFVVPTAVDTPLLFPMDCFHRLILPEKVTEKITAGGSRNKMKEIHQRGETNQIQN